MVQLCSDLKPHLRQSGTQTLNRLRNRERGHPLTDVTLQGLRVSDGFWSIRGCSGSRALWIGAIQNPSQPQQRQAADHWQQASPKQGHHELEAMNER